MYCISKILKVQYKKKKIKFWAYHVLQYLFLESVKPSKNHKTTSTEWHCIYYKRNHARSIYSIIGQGLKTGVQSPSRLQRHNPCLWGRNTQWLLIISAQGWEGGVGVSDSFPVILTNFNSHLLHLINNLNKWKQANVLINYINKLGN